MPFSFVYSKIDFDKLEPPTIVYSDGSDLNIYFEEVRNSVNIIWVSMINFDLVLMEKICLYFQMDFSLYVRYQIYQFKTNKFSNEFQRNNIYLNM